MSLPSRKVNNVNCCVYGCHSKKSKNQNLSFHHFPKSNTINVTIVNERGIPEVVDKKKAWILKIRTGKPVTPHMRVCSLHFKKEDYILPDIPAKRKILKREAIPTQNLPVGSIPKRITTRKPRARQQSLAETAPAATASTSLLSVEPLDEQSYSNEELVAANSLLDSINFGSTSIGVQVTSGDILQSFVELITTDAKLNTMTGLANFKMLASIESSYKELFSEIRVKKTSVRERIILTFVKLKQNVSYKVLAILFKSLTPLSCKNVFNDTLNKLHLILEVCIFWPSKQEVLDNMPICFKGFEDVRIVLDCTEILMQKSKCLCCRLKSYSYYKSHNTIKYLCGVSPGGLITFISKGYGGRTSDKCIFEQSKLIEKLNMYEDAIMVDKGFRIDEIVGSYGIKLIRPPFLRKNVQLSKEDTDQTAKIAKARVHVELFQRVKLFKILSQPITWNMLPNIDSIFTICCAITNMSSPILADDKYLE